MNSNLSYASRWKGYLYDDPLVLHDEGSVVPLAHRDDESSVEGRGLGTERQRARRGHKDPVGPPISADSFRPTSVPAAGSGKSRPAKE